MALREAFIAPPGGYFDCAYKGLMPRAAADAAAVSTAELDLPWKPGHGEALRHSLTATVGSLIGLHGDELALIPSTSYGMAIARQLATPMVGRGVIVIEDEHPAAVLPWRAQQCRTGARLVTARWSDADPTASVLAALDDTIGVVCVPQAHWIDGMPLDLEAIGRRAKAVGALFVVDATQTVGARPLNVAALQPDIFIFSGYKWLWGPLGLAYLYVAPHLRAGEPIEHSWVSHAGMATRMFDDAGQLAYRDDPLVGSHRFDTSGLHNPLILRMALAGVEMVRDVGLDVIAAHNKRILDSIAEAFPGRVRPSQASRHFLGLQTKDARVIAKRLEHQEIYVSPRGSALRISPNVWNDDGDVIHLLEALRECDSSH